MEIEGRGLGRQPFGPLVASTEADLKKKVEPKPAVKDDGRLDVQPELAAKGKATVRIGWLCKLPPTEVGQDSDSFVPDRQAAEHVEAGRRMPEPKLTAEGLPKLRLECGPEEGAGRRDRQVAEPPAREPSAIIARTMLTFNCYACHARDKIGGPTEATSPAFITTTPEMGDEGRVPPPLDGVGAKLNAEYMKQILDKGADDRPYMHTRMPGFGAANVGHLVDLFAAHRQAARGGAGEVHADASRKLSRPAGTWSAAKAFGCIKCHTFAGDKAEGVQGIDMLLMPKRLQARLVPRLLRRSAEDPTRHAHADRVARRARARCPHILDGACVHADRSDLGLSQEHEPGDSCRHGPAVYPADSDRRGDHLPNFIQGAGTRAIGVGYPEKLNLAFDANDLRLAMIWKGGFIDAARHWTDRGAGFEGPLGDDIVHLPTGAAFAVLDKPDAAWPTGSPRKAGFKFLGYKLTKDDRPTFRYAFKDVTIEDFPNPTGTLANPTLKREFTLTAKKPIEGLYFRALAGKKIEPIADGWYKLDELKVRIDGAKPIVRKSGGQSELLVPVPFSEGKAKFTMEFAW